MLLMQKREMTFAPGRGVEAGEDGEDMDPVYTGWIPPVPSERAEIAGSGESLLRLRRGRYRQAVGPYQETCREQLPKSNRDRLSALDQMIATYFKVAHRTVYRLAAAKKISAPKVGGTWRISRAETDNWIKRQSGIEGGQG
jgi:excisionase family DNA binding protein